jgi:hypothetical protein
VTLDTRGGWGCRASLRSDAMNKANENERHPEVVNAVARAQQLVDSKTQEHDVTMWLHEARHVGDVLALAVATSR